MGLELSNVRATEISGELNAVVYAFIIPNRSIGFDDQYFPENAKKLQKKILEQNGLEFDPDCRLVQIWFASDDLQSSNLRDHGFSIEVDGKKVRIENGYMPGHLPSNLIANWKEGEEQAFRMKKKVVGIISGENNRKIDIKLKMQLTVIPAQQKYRYRQFGNFEKVLDMVTAPIA